MRGCRILKPNWAPVLPPRVDYSLYLEKKKSTPDVTRKVQIGKMKAAHMKKALEKAATTLPVAIPPDYAGWAQAAIERLIGDAGDAINCINAGDAINCASAGSRLESHTHVLSPVDVFMIGNGAALSVSMNTR